MRAQPRRILIFGAGKDQTYLEYSDITVWRFVYRRMIFRLNRDISYSATTQPHEFEAGFEQRRP